MIRDDLPGTAPELPDYQLEEVLGEMLPGFESVAVRPRVRYAKCEACSHIEPITGYVPLFKAQPWNDMDRYYCGCRGWE